MNSYGNDSNIEFITGYIIGKEHAMFIDEYNTLWIRRVQLSRNGDVKEYIHDVDYGGVILVTDLKSKKAQEIEKWFTYLKSMNALEFIMKDFLEQGSGNLGLSGLVYDLKNEQD